VGNGTRRRPNWALGGGKGRRVISLRESPLMDGPAPNATVPSAPQAPLHVAAGQDANYNMMWARAPGTGFCDSLSRVHLFGSAA